LILFRAQHHDLCTTCTCAWYDDKKERIYVTE
jgi:hypothetical protein